jgi:hypothetical protein
MNLFKMPALALGLAACQPDTCPDDLRRAKEAAWRHEDVYKDVHEFARVSPKDCIEVMEVLRESQNSILKACEIVVRHAKEKEQEEERATLSRKRERAQWCEGANIPQPNDLSSTPTQ